MSAAGRTVETVLYLAGFSNVKSKVCFFSSHISELYLFLCIWKMLTFIVFNLQIIGSRNPLNVIKALFIALNAVCAHLFLIIYQPIRIFAFLTLGAID